MSDETVTVMSWEEFKARDFSAGKQDRRNEMRDARKAIKADARQKKFIEMVASLKPKRDFVAELGGPEKFAEIAIECPEVVAILSKELLARGLVNTAFGRGIKTTRAGNFYQSKAWAAVRYAALMKHSARCQCCGATAADGASIHVDHIKPRSKFPDLALELSNLQVLCGLCNTAKSNIDQTDWSGQLPDESGDYFEYMEDERRIVRLLRSIC